MMESEDVEPNHVMMVMQRGYTLNGRLLRPGHGCRGESESLITVLTLQTAAH